MLKPALQTKPDTFASSADPDETTLFANLLLTLTDIPVFKIKEGRVHFINPGVKGIN